MNNNSSHRYDNMINVERPKALRPMSPINRAAQFSPFAALTGYDDAVSETARLTEDEIYLTESQINNLDYKLQILCQLDTAPEITITYFVPDAESHADSVKSGGAYLTHTGVIKKVDTNAKTIIFKDLFSVSMDRIIDITSEIFDKCDY